MIAACQVVDLHGCPVNVEIVEHLSEYDHDQNQ